jgi:septal ring factor EnvC (AmiA/AmiB activator)
MSIDGLFDAHNTIQALQEELRTVTMNETRRKDTERRIETLTQSREGSFEFLMESAEQLKAVIRELEPIAKFSFENVEKSVRSA